MVDVDHFKRFNDAFGHDVGDLVLKNIGELLRRSVRQGDLACRYGGVGFTLVLPGTTGWEALDVAERVREGARRLEIAYRNQVWAGSQYRSGWRPIRWRAKPSPS